MATAEISKFVDPTATTLAIDTSRSPGLSYVTRFPVVTTPTNDLPPFDGAVTVDTPALAAVILALSKVRIGL